MSAQPAPKTETVNLQLHYKQYLSTGSKIFLSGRYNVGSGEHGLKCLRCQHFEPLSGCDNCGYGTFEVALSKSNSIGIFCEQCEKGLTRWTCKSCGTDNPMNGSFVSVGGGFCFVATAAFGDENAPEVLFFRAYRDTTLSESSLGRRFIETYYRFSPRMAGVISASMVLRRCARAILRAVMVVLR